MQENCSFDECTCPVEGDGLCATHRLQRTLGLRLTHLRPGKTRQICLFPGCGKLVNGLKLCHGHYRQAREGRPLAPLRQRLNQGYIDRAGYRVRHVRGHPNAHGERKNVIREHVLVMSQILDRPLRRGENVHHKNGVRDDNRPQNLVLWSTAQPAGQAVTDKLEFATELLETYPQMLTDEQRKRIAQVLSAAPAPCSGDVAAPR